MFSYSLGILQTLHEEHTAMLAVLERLDTLLTTQGPKSPPDMSQGDVSQLIDDVMAALGNDVSFHYDFEEQHLFPVFASRGGPMIPGMLRQEHNIIRPQAEAVVALAAKAKTAGFSAADWATFHAAAQEVGEREIFHIQKEEMGFLPALNQVLMAEEDEELQKNYAAIKGAA